jgi:azurin
VVRDEQIFVLGRNQITRLNDLNGDGETDWYECFSKAFKTSPGGHDYICGLQTDQAGNFYTASGDEGILQISSDGRDAKVIAKGFRNPDGIGILPDGSITCPASEGNWTPTSMIFRIVPKSRSANGASEFETSNLPFGGYNGPKNGGTVTLPMLYLPRGVDNSSGGQVWIDEPKMGPLNQQLLHTSYGSGQAMLILQDKVGDQWQGAAVVLRGEYSAGIHRARVNPKDGQVYLSGMAGWGTYTSEQGCFQRLRYTGDWVQLPDSFHVHRNGLMVRFRNPVDRTVLTDRDAHFAQCWNYRYSPGYGSKEFSVLHPPMVGHDHLNITAVHAIDDRTVFVELPELQLCNQLHLRLKVAPDSHQELFATVHAMDEDFIDFPTYRASTSKVLISHPMKRDLEWISKSVPNPWKTRIDKARFLRIEARDNLQFSSKTLEASPGEILKLTFSNPDVVPHNWALLRPGSLERIGAITNTLVNDPDAYLRHYVPDSKDVLCYTDIVDPQDETAIYFRAPDQPGRYPYLCTFPGHWMVMNGELVVK